MSLGIVALMLIVTLSVSAPPARGQANVKGQWQTLPATMPINPVHVALMHNGLVLIVSGSGNLPSDLNYEAAVWNPVTDAITTQPLDFDMFCNGMIVLPDGRPFVMSGTLQYDPFHGDLRTSAYDPTTGIFVDMQPMAHGRWYPTATTLSDGSVMVFSGLDENGNTNTTVEIYKLGVGWSAPYQAQWTPPLYPRMHLLPNGNVFYSGSTTSSAIFNTTSHAWTTGVANTIYTGTRTYGTSVLLPLTPANNYKPVVMIMGGGSPATKTTELIDLSASSPKWTKGPNMSQARIEMDATILPNGKVLAVNGSVNDEDASTASLNADLYDPVANTFSSAGTATYPRLYHSGSILLPDATVLVLGGNPQRGTYEHHLEIYSPAYLFNSSGGAAARPTITSITPGVLGYGSAFQIQTPDAANISSAVLVRAGAVTHAFDMEQRLVGLSFTAGSGALNATAPSNGGIAPPGYYMLFILNSSGVPSLAQFVQLSNAPNDQPPSGNITSPASNVSIPVGQSVFFAGTGTSPNGTITGYSWVFPGGTPSTSLLANPGSVTYVKSGTYTASLTVTDSTGLTDPSPQTRTIAVSSDFALSATPASRTISPGGGTTYAVTVTPAAGFAGTVSFSVTGLPSGASTSFNPAAVNSSGSTTMNVTTSTSVPAGSYPLTVTGTSGALVHSTNVTLVVSATGVGTIQYVQSNYADPQASQSPVNVTFTAAQTGGNLNVVVVGWSDSTFNVSSVTDSMHNGYIRALNPTVVGGFESQVIYYAKNIAAAPANGNTVTVTFNGQAAYPDIRILEYSGADPTSPFDVAAAASGTNSPTNSGTVTTTNANDLIFGASIVWTSNTGPGSGFTMRILTQPNHDLVEDELVTATGNYNATAPLNNSGPWIMQLVAFKGQH
jgi:hypothetical protein